MKKAILAATIAASTVFLSLLAYNKSRKPQVHPRQCLLSIFKQLHSKMFLHLVEIASFVRENAAKVPPEQIRDYVMDEGSGFMNSIKDVLAEIFRNGGITEEEFQYNVQNYYKDDVEIQYHMKRYKEEFQKAMLGVTPEIKEQISTFITGEKLIKIVKEMLEFKMEILRSAVTEKTSYKQIVLALRAKKEEERKKRIQKLKDLGLVGTDEQLTSIFQFSIAKFLKMDKQFAEKYQKVLEQYNKESNQFIDRFCAFPRATSKKSIAS